MIVSELKRILEILEKNDLGSKYIESDYDVIYIPIESRDDINKVDFIELEDSGMFYSTDYDSFVIFT